MDTLNEIISLLRVVIIPLGVTFRVVFCLIKMIYDEEAQGSYKRKIRNTIVFGIIAAIPNNIFTFISKAIAILHNIICTKTVKILFTSFSE